MTDSTKHQHTETRDFVEIGGDIIDASTGELLPAQREQLLPDWQQSADLDALIASYADPQPDPRQVFAWIMEAAEGGDVEEDDPTVSIMVRIMQGRDTGEILGAQEVIAADDVLGVKLQITGVKFRKSSFAQGAKCYALISAHRDDTDTDVLISCGGKNVQTQLLNLNYRGLLPARACITKSAKPTANGFYPLWLEPC